MGWSIDCDSIYKTATTISSRVYMCNLEPFNISIPDGLVVMISACHAGDRGSIPRRGAQPPSIGSANFSFAFSMTVLAIP